MPSYFLFVAALAVAIALAVVVVIVHTTYCSTAMASSTCAWSVEAIVNLIDLFEERPCLFDTKHKICRLVIHCRVHSRLFYCRLRLLFVKSVAHVMIATAAAIFLLIIPESCVICRLQTSAPELQHTIYLFLHEEVP